MTTDPKAPPVETTETGAVRRVGVEIEFAGINVIEAANVVRDVLGGEAQHESVHRISVRDTDIGDVTVELDAQIVHASGDEAADGDPEIDEIKAKSREVLGHAVAVVVPTEIVCPPVDWSDLGRLDTVFDALRSAGAEGTDDGVLYGFGLHLNPEVAEQTADYALRHLQAYVLLEDWLRETIDIDPMRAVLPHIDAFSSDYARHLMEIDEAPAIDELIRDYLTWNPTRNRGLDMTPLWRHLDEETVVEVMDDVSLINARPTFHYRLPDARLSNPDWGVAVEWNRWIEVERLAHDTDMLRGRRAELVAWLDKPAPARWLETLRGWFNT